jgi:hypothetical protein
MRLGELLVVQGLVTPEDVEAALERQKREGGPIGTHLVAMGVLTTDRLLAVLPGLQRWQAMHGPNHPNTYRARYSYARALLAAGRPMEALKHAQAALDGYRATIGEKHAWTGEALQLILKARQVMTNKALQLETDARQYTDAVHDKRKEATTTPAI